MCALAQGHILVFDTFLPMRMNPADPDGPLQWASTRRDALQGNWRPVDCGRWTVHQVPDEEWGVLGDDGIVRVVVGPSEPFVTNESDLPQAWR